jgi:hypothetical protein
MENTLKKTYFSLLAPAIILLLFMVITKRAKIFSFGHIEFINIIAAFIFVLSVILGIGLPIFYRSLFAHRMRDRHSVTLKELIHFERTLILSAMITPYLTIIGYLLEFPRFYLAGTLMTALYAGYYFYPSKKRIRFEKRIFRVK